MAKVKYSNVKLIPTLFQLNCNHISSESGYIKINLNRVYDDHIKRNMNEVSITNAILPDQAQNKDIEYRLCSKQSGKEIVLKLPTRKETKMLYMERIEENSNNIFACMDREEKTIKFYDIDNESLYGLNISEDSKMNHILEVIDKAERYYFACWTEYLPIPGETDGTFAYVDGSSVKTAGKEDKGIPEPYGAGVISCRDRNISFWHHSGKSPAANDIGEVEAATHFLNTIIESKFEGGKVWVFFDNTQVGYYPGGIFSWKEDKDPDYKNKYKDSIDKFANKHKNVELVFCHVDAHYKVFGNELADRIAQVNPKLLDKFPSREEFELVREEFKNDDIEFYFK